MAARIGGAAIAGSPMFSGGNAPSRSSLRIEDRRYTVLLWRTLQETAAAITRPILTIPRYPGRGEFEAERGRTRAPRLPGARNRLSGWIQNGIRPLLHHIISGGNSHHLPGDLSII